MSRITLSGNASGTGTFTVASPNSNTDRTLTLPDVSGTAGLNPLPNVALAGVPAAGVFEFDGTTPYFTPTGLQRGAVPAAQFYRLNADRVGADATGAQSIFGVGVTLASNTIYRFEMLAAFVKSGGVVSHTISLLFGGTATVNNILYGGPIMNTFNTRDDITEGVSANTAGAVTFTSALTAATIDRVLPITGTISIATGGTIIPQYSLSAAPSGGAYSTRAGSYIAFWPIGSAGVVSVGTWA